MPPFRCKMATQNGRIVESTLLAESKTVLKARLEKEGNFVIDITKIKGTGSFAKKGQGKVRLNEKELYSFNLEFSVLLRAGLSIVGALDTIIEKDDNGDLSELLKVIRFDISNGESLSASFGNYSHIFSNLYIATLKAGEMSGDIPLALSRFMDYTKKMAEIKQKIVSASIYPLILLTASIGVLTFLLIFVVPAIAGNFNDSGNKLPFITQMIVTISDFLREYVVHIGVAILGVGSGFAVYRKTPEGELLLDRFQLLIPFLGPLTVHYSVSKLSRTLSTIIGGGTTLLESLKIAVGTMENIYLRNKINKVSKDIEEGKGFAESLKQTGVIPDMAIRMISAGENSGALEQVLNEVADFYEADVESKLSVMASAIEPTLMIIMGFTIGFIVLAMYMPIFQMAGTVG